MTTELFPSNSVRYAKGKHPNSLKNLKPYPPGVNGHQGVYSLTNALKHSLNKPLTKPKEDAPVAERIIYSTLEGALEREPTPFKEVWDRIDGRLQDVAPSFQIDNRSLIIIVDSEKAKELTENVSRRLLVDGK